MNPDILILIVSSLPYLSMGVLFYFVAVRKNAFEERVAHYIPYHALERERSTYMEKVEKYKRYICIGLGIFLSVFIVLPFVLFFVTISKGGGNFSVSEQLTLLMIPLFLFLMIYYLLSYVVKTTCQSPTLVIGRNEQGRFCLSAKSTKGFALAQEIFSFFHTMQRKSIFFQV